jgi:hypothetical protein
LACWFIVLVLLVRGGFAFAAVQRTFVASTGIDANPCSLTQPCRTFAAAISKTLAGGEVIVLDSAGYGPVTIAQSVTISAPAGVYAGISVFSGEGITVSGPTIDVTLRGLTINGLGGTTGINFANGASFVVDRCVISGFSQRAIVQVSGRMLVRDTLISGGAGQGIVAFSPATIERVTVTGVGGVGITVEGTSVSIRDSSIDGIGGDGLVALGSVPPTNVTLDSVSITGANNGIRVVSNTASTSAFVDVVRSRITTNGSSGIESTASAGIALVHVTDSLVSLNFLAGLLTTLGGEITASGNTIVNNGNYGFDTANSGVFTMKNNQVKDNAPANVNGVPNPLGFD